MEKRMIALITLIAVNVAFAQNENASDQASKGRRDCVIQSEGVRDGKEEFSLILTDNLTNKTEQLLIGSFSKVWASAQDAKTQCYFISFRNLTPNNVTPWCEIKSIPGSDNVALFLSGRRNPVMTSSLEQVRHLIRGRQGPNNFYGSYSMLCGQGISLDGKPFYP